MLYNVISSIFSRTATTGEWISDGEGDNGTEEKGHEESCKLGRVSVQGVKRGCFIVLVTDRSGLS